ncbi:MAG: adenosylcobinamide-GDP ribazoletransferase [Bacillota bacterium]|nr:adenosylcobinamide-GDP ribazoletransferase [Bacillota bacterium]
MEYVKGFLILIAYFTRIPIGSLVEFHESRFRKGISLFPLLGLVFFGILLILSWALSYLHTDSAILGSSLIMVMYMLLSGGIHIDGLADSFDGFFSGREKEKIFAIMSDPHIGTFGVLGIIMVYLINIGALSGMIIPEILIFPYIARIHAYFVASFLPYAKESGMGKTFVDSADIRVALAHYIVFGVVTGLFFDVGMYGTILTSAGLSLVFAITAAGLSYRKIGGLTGDSMGMMIELSQTGYMLSFHILYHSYLFR